MRLLGVFVGGAGWLHSETWNVYKGHKCMIQKETPPCNSLRCMLRIGTRYAGRHVQKRDDGWWVAEVRVNIPGP
jgi:hypothetical protein